MSAVTLSNEERGLDGENLPWPVLRAIVLLRDEFTCAMCGGYATQVDHILARAHWGTDELDNLQAACKPCNQRKGDWLLTERPEFYLHLTLPQIRYHVDQMNRLVKRGDSQIRFLCDRIDALEAAS